MNTSSTASNRYQPIENYGVIGNMRTVALVGMNGSIDWYCCPAFDSPSVFGAILDADKGGRFQIAVVGEDVHQKQFYWPDTNVLVTRFFSQSGIAEIHDFMPAGLTPGFQGPDDYHQIVRQLKCVKGACRFSIVCEPAFNYARTPHKTELHPTGAVFRTPDLTLSLSTSVPLQRSDRGVLAECVLEEGSTRTLILRKVENHGMCRREPTEEEAEMLFHGTVRYWRRWLADCTYQGRWREEVYRSALVLKLLTYEPTGAIVAAPTTSLPEYPGGSRNWDYRYTWIRDAAFTLYGLLRIGLTREAEGFMHWLATRRSRHAEGGAPLQIMYGIDGRSDLKEEILSHLEGYQGSKPVRIGNDAHLQIQMDIYGELIDSIYLYNKYAQPISYDAWTQLRNLLNWIADHWHEPDHGIWEFRIGRQEYVHSKIMSWVALDRGVRLAEKRSFPADRLRWLAERDKIYEEIMSKGWNPERNAFVQHYGSNSLDASSLLMPLVFFLAPNDPRMLKTLDSINRPPHHGGLVSDGLVFRYDLEARSDGIEGPEGTFNMCSFWLVEAMTRAGRTDPKRLEEARLLFERMLGYANHLGLYSEETGPKGQALGNFPQAFTHLALISAAFNLDRTLGTKNGHSRG